MAHRGRACVLLFALALASACSTVRTGLPKSTAKPVPTRHVLANGVRVVIEEHRASDVVALQLWVQAGGRDEAASELGLAHYLEHMLFKGTPTRPPGFVDRDVESVGGRINAGTSWDYTFYHTVLPARRAAAGVDMLADIAVNATLDAALLDAEKAVVLEEMRLNNDNPRRFLGTRLYGLLFDGHPYGRPVIGTPDLIRSLTPETLRRFYRRHYGPESFTLVVVGAVNPADILARATGAFARMPRSGFSRFPPPAPPAGRDTRIEIPRPGSQAHLGMAWLGPRIDHAETPAVDLLVTILGQSRSSRLSQSLRDNHGLVTTIRAGFSALEAAGAIVVTAQLDPGNLVRAEEEIVREVRRIRERGVTEAERRRAITAAEAQHEFAIETAEGRARALGLAETVWELEEQLAYVDRIRSVSAEQIRAAARRYLDPGRYTRVALVPPPTR